MTMPSDPRTPDPRASSAFLRKVMRAKRAQRRRERLQGLLTAIVVVLGVAAIAGLSNLWVAQLTVWGLNQFHVHSGLLGPWLLIPAAETVIAVGQSSVSKNNNK